jgi:hypothetical protein
MCSIVPYELGRLYIMTSEFDDNVGVSRAGKAPRNDRNVASGGRVTDAGRTENHGGVDSEAIEYGGSHSTIRSPSCSVTPDVPPPGGAICRV